MGRAIGSPTSMTSDYSPENEKARVREPRLESPPSLEKWMGMTKGVVSPFGELTVTKGRDARTGNVQGRGWPLEKSA